MILLNNFCSLWLNSGMAGIGKKSSHFCEVCQQPFSQSSHRLVHIRSVHLNIEKKFSCEVCNGVYRTRAYLKLHKTSSHSDEKRYSYQDCPQQLKLQRHLRIHKNVHQGKDKRHICDICSTTFARKHALRKHVREIHQNLKHLKCKICDLMFSRNEYLDKHIV